MEFIFIHEVKTIMPEKEGDSKDKSQKEHESREHEKEHKNHEHHKAHEEHHESHSEHRKSGKGFLNNIKVFQALTVVLAIALLLSIFAIASTSRKLNAVSQKVDDALKNVDAKSATELKSALTDVKNTISTKSAEPAKASGKAVDAHIYVMSQCPYGVQAEDGLIPAVKALGPNVNLKIDFIVSENADGTFRSLHGDNEVKGDIAQLCAAKYEPVRYLDMIMCMNKAASAIPGNWEACAKEAGITNTDKIKACYEGSEGTTLLSESAKASESVNAQGSPTIYLGGNLYQSGRETADFMRALCSGLTGVSACSEIPKCSADYDCTEQADKIGVCNNPGKKDASCTYLDDAELNAVVISDKRCPECEQVVTQLKPILQQNFFKGIKYKDVDYSENGKSLMEKLNITLLPTMIFDSTIEETYYWKNSDARFKSAFQKAGNYYYIIPQAMGASYDPYCDAGENCADSRCKESMACRTEEKKNLKVFVMSECPFGIQGENAMKEVLENFKGNMDFEIHFIASETSPGVFQSLHGPTEVAEDINQLCVMKYDNAKLMDYVWCRNENIKGDWKPCAEKAGIDTAKIETCANGDEGKALLSADIKIAEGLGISASPTWLVNNRNIFNGIDAETVRSNYCSANSGLEGCENTLSTNTQAAANAPACG